MYVGNIKKRHTYNQSFQLYTTEHLFLNKKVIKSLNINLFNADQFTVDVFTNKS